VIPYNVFVSDYLADSYQALFVQQVTLVFNLNKNVVSKKRNEL